MWAAFLPLLLTITGIYSDQFKVTGPDRPVVGRLGGEVVLECQLVPEQPAARLEIRWIRGEPEYNELVHLHRFGEDLPESQAPAYTGRTSLFRQLIPQGNVSLRLTGLTLQDGGEYVCIVGVGDGGKFERSGMTLKVASLGSPPMVGLSGLRDGGVGLSCVSPGWFPAPTVTWLTDKGGTLPEPGVSPGQPQGQLHDVNSKVTVYPQLGNSFQCLLLNKVLGETVQGSVKVPDVFYPRVSGYLYGFVFVLLLSLLAVGVSVYFYRRRWLEVKGLRCRPSINEYENSKQKEAKLQGDVDLLEADLARERQLSITAAERIIKFAMPVTFDPDSANPYLDLSDDLLTVSFSDGWKDLPANARRFEARLFITAREGVAPGRRAYWEVVVGDKPDWDLGVAAEGVRRGEWVDLCPAKRFWTLGRRGGRLAANDEPELVGLDGIPAPRVLGVLADCPPAGGLGRVAFTDAERLTPVYSFPVSLDAPQTLFPFFSPWGSKEPVSLNRLPEWGGS